MPETHEEEQNSSPQGKFVNAVTDAINEATRSGMTLVQAVGVLMYLNAAAKYSEETLKEFDEINEDPNVKSFIDSVLDAISEALDNGIKRYEITASLELQKVDLIDHHKYIAAEVAQAVIDEDRTGEAKTGEAE